MWQNIIAAIISSSILTGIFLFIIKRGIANQFEKDLEKHKSELKHKSDLAIVQLTKDLELKASERNIKLTELFQRQADAIEIVHNKLYNYYAASLAHDRTRLLKIPNVEQKFARELLEKEFEAFRTDFIKHLIYLPNPTRLQIETIINTILQKDNYFRIMEMAGGIDCADSETVQKIDKQILEIKAKLPNLLDALKNDMQTILGIANKT